VRTRLGAAEEHCVLVAVAALTRRKGLDVLFEAVAGLGAARLRVLVWIVGEGVERIALEERARQLGVASNFLWVAPTSRACMRPTSPWCRRAGKAWA
jgi:glycosyltransferase involved in cell wall biosynthesis